MLYAYVERFDVLRNLKNFINFFKTKQGLQYYSPGVQISGNKKLQRLYQRAIQLPTVVRGAGEKREWRGREIHSAFVARTDFWQPFNDPPDDAAHRFHPRCCLFPCFPPRRLLASLFHPFLLVFLLLPSRHGVVRRAPPRLAGKVSTAAARTRKENRFFFLFCLLFFVCYSWKLTTVLVLFAGFCVRGFSWRERA